MTLRRKLCLVLMTVFIGVILVVGYLFYTKSLNRLEETLKFHLSSHLDSAKETASLVSRLVIFSERSLLDRASNFADVLFKLLDAFSGKEESLKTLLEKVEKEGVNLFLLKDSSNLDLKLPEGIKVSDILLTSEGRELLLDPSGEKFLAVWKKGRDAEVYYLALISLNKFDEGQEKFIYLARELLLESFGYHFIGNRGYVQVFSSDGKLLFSRGKEALEEDDLFESPFIKEIFNSERKLFAYEFKGERKIRAGIRIAIPGLFSEIVLISTLYLSDFSKGLVYPHVFDLALMGITLLILSLLLVNRYLKKGFYSFLDSLSRGFDSLIRGNYEYRMERVGERYLDELVDKFNNVGLSLDTHKRELSKAYSELLKMHMEVKGSKDELEATYAQLKAYAGTLEKLTEELSKSNELLRMIVRVGENLLDLSKAPDPYLQMYDSLKRFYKDCTVGIYKPSEGGRTLIRMTGDGEESLRLDDFIWEEVLKETKPLLLLEGEERRLFVPINFEAKLYGVIFMKSEGDQISKLDLDIISMLAGIVGVAMANAGYLESVTEKAKKLGVLAQVSEVLASSRNVIEDLKLALENFANRLEYDCIEIFLRKGDFLHKVASSGKVSEVDYGERGWDINRGICGWVARYGKGVFIPDVSKDHRYVEVIKGIKSEIVVPILGDGEIYGVINLESFKELSFDDYEILSILGRQLGMALRKERLFKDALKEAKKFKTLYELSLRLNSLESLDVVLSEVCERIERERDYVDVTVAVYDKRSQSWNLLAGKVKDRVSEEVFKNLEKTGGVISKALREGCVINVPDVRKVDYYVKVFDETLSELAVPIDVGGEVKGVLNIESPRLNDFSEEEEEFFGSIANVIGLVLAREYLLEDLRAQGRRLETLLEISRGLMVIHEEDELYRYLCKALAEKLKYKRVAYRKIDWERGVALLKGEAGVITGVGESTNLDRGTIGGYVAFTSQVFRSSDVDSDLRIKRKYIEVAKSVIAVPLKRDGSVNGILFAIDTERDAFSDQDERLLITAVNLLSSSLDRLEYMNAIKRKSSFMNLLYNLSLRLSQCLSEDEVYDVVVDFLKKVEVYSRITIFLLRGEELVLVRYHPVPGKIDKVRLGEGITGWVALHGESLLVKDVSKDSRYVEGLEGMRSELAVPVKVKGKVYAVLNLESEVEEAFTEEDRWLLEAVSTSMGIVLENIFHLREIEDNLFATTLALAKAVEYKDPYTRGHCERVMGYSDAIAVRIGLSEEDRKRLRYACILHDIGKIGIPGRILDKPGKLTEEEYEIVKRHSILGEDLVKDVPFLKDIALLIRWHHERWDGKGYPDGLKGYEIPLEDRIMAIADAFDAMTSDRPYRRALSIKEAIEEIRRGMGGQFDPVLTSEFLKIIEGGEVGENRP